MFDFGDSHKTNSNTVRFVESIVMKRLKTIVQEELKYTDEKILKVKN